MAAPGGGISANSSSGSRFAQPHEAGNVTWGRDLPDAGMPDFTDEAVLDLWESRLERETLVTHPAGVVFAPSFPEDARNAPWGWLVGARCAGASTSFGGEEAVSVVGSVGCTGLPASMMATHRVMYDEADSVLSAIPLGLRVVGVFARDVHSAAEVLDYFVAPTQTEVEVRDQFFGKMAQAFAPRGPEAWNDVLVCSLRKDRAPTFFWTDAVPNENSSPPSKVPKQLNCVLAPCTRALASESPLQGTHIALRCQIPQIEVTVRDVERILVNSDELDRTLLGFNYDHEMACIIDLPDGPTVLVDHAGALRDGRSGDSAPEYSGVFAGGSFRTSQGDEASTSDVLGARIWNVPPEELSEIDTVAGVHLLRVTPFLNPPNDYTIKGADGRATPVGSPLIAHLDLDATVFVQQSDSIWFAIEMLGIALRSQLRILFEMLRERTAVERQGALVPYFDVKDDVLRGCSRNPFHGCCKNQPLGFRSVQVIMKLTP